MESVDLSVLIVSWNTRQLLKQCIASALESLRTLTGEVIVVDNASSDGSAAMVRDVFGTDQRVRIIVNSTNKNYAHGNNQAFAASHGTVLALVNPDIVLTNHALDAMLLHLKTHPEVGLVTCQLVGPDGRRQSIHRAFPTIPFVIADHTRIGRLLDHRVMRGRFRRRFRMVNLIENQDDHAIAIEQAAGACLVLRRDLVDRLGVLFDERFPLFFNDVDLSLRAQKAGFRVELLTTVPVTHHGSASLVQLEPADRELAWWDGLVAYYSKHHPGWRARIVRMIRKRAVRRF